MYKINFFRNLPKREWEYDIEDSKYEYEYGFYEPPVEKLEENRLMFREALEVLLSVFLFTYC